MSFFYKVLLVDDRQESMDRLKKCTGLEPKQCRTVDETLQMVFDVTDIYNAPVGGFPQHGFDLVLLDFELEPGQDKNPEHQILHGKDPLGGLTLFPILAHSFEGPGPCVVACYSAILDRTDRLKRLKKFFEIGQNLMHGSDLKIAQAGFKDFSLVPLIKERSNAILKQCPMSVFVEIQEAARQCGGNLGKLLDEFEIPSLTRLLGKKMTLGCLRPDIGRRIFREDCNEDPSRRVIADEERRDFREWIRLANVSSSLCCMMRDLWNSVEIDRAGHAVGVNEPSDFWRKLISFSGGGARIAVHMKQTGKLRHGAEVVYSIPLCVAEKLVEMTWTSNVNRFEKFHRFFRLSVADTAVQRMGHGAGYAKGYFLEDINRSCRYTIQARYRMSDCPVRYVYIPQFLLSLFLEQLGDEAAAKTLSVDITMDNSFLEFSTIANIPISEQQAISLASAKTWKMFPGIDSWGEFVVVDEYLRGWASGPSGAVSIPMIDSSLYANSYALRFPMES